MVTAAVVDDESFVGKDADVVDGDDDAAAAHMQPTRIDAHYWVART